MTFCFISMVVGDLPSSSEFLNVEHHRLEVFRILILHRKKLFSSVLQNGPRKYGGLVSMLIQFAVDAVFCSIYSGKPD